MKLKWKSFVLAALVVETVSICACRQQKTERPRNAFMVSVKAGDVNTAMVLPFKVFALTNGVKIPIQDCALEHRTLATFCTWSDHVKRSISVEADGYQPREYEISGKTNIIVMLYPKD